MYRPIGLLNVITDHVEKSKIVDVTMRFPEDFLDGLRDFKLVADSSNLTGLEGMYAWRAL